MLAYSDDGRWKEWQGEPRPLGRDVFSLPVSAEEHLSDSELARYGLKKVGAAATVPAGYRVTSASIGDDNGAPRWVNVVEPIPLAELKAGRLAELAARRWQAETAGTVVAGVAVMTDRESQALITGAALQAVLDGSYSASWKTADGSFQTLSAAQLLAIAKAVRAHVQACFDREAVLAKAIDDAADLTAIEAVDLGSGWPTA